MVNGSKITVMGKAQCFIIMEHPIQDSGKKESNMEKAYLLFLKVTTTTDFGKMVRCTAKEF